jgi:hypothetical protein
MQPHLQLKSYLPPQQQQHVAWSVVQTGKNVRLEGLERLKTWYRQITLCAQSGTFSPFFILMQGNFPRVFEDNQAVQQNNSTCCF